MNEFKTKNCAIVTAAIGAKYLDLYNKRFRASHERYAKYLECPLYVVSSLIDTSTKGTSRHPAWQALLIFEIPELKQYEYLLWIDADIYIRNPSKNILDLASDSTSVWMAAKNNAYDIPRLTKGDPSLFDKCPTEHRPDTMLNLGVFLADRKIFAPIMRKVYDESEEQPCYYQGPLTYAFFNTTRGIILPPYFNTIVASYRERYGYGLSIILKCFTENGFIHFAGGAGSSLLVNIITQIDTKPNSLLTKLIMFVGKKEFDSFNNALLRIMKKLTTIAKI